MHDLARILTERLSAGLRNKSLTSPSRYAEAVRVMGKPFPGPWTFKWHPWLREMHDSKATVNVGQKAAQVGFTETLLNITFFKIDVERVDCLYVLPSKMPDAHDFSSGRFDPALELSAHLSKIFSDVKNIGHKRAGSVNLYVRGSKARTGFKSIPIGFLDLYEVDEMQQDNIPLARERLSGQRIFQEWLISTPTIDNQGINKYYVDSSKETFFFPCSHCSTSTTPGQGRMTQLIFPDCLEITAESFDDPNLAKSFLKCKECKTKLDHEDKPNWLKKGKWIPEDPKRDNRGFHINQLYSSAEIGRPENTAKAYLKSLTDKAEEQSFWNDKMGVPHMVKGARLTDHQIDLCKS